MTSEENKDDVRVPMCGPSVDLNQEWNESAAELRSKIQAVGFVQNDDPNIEGVGSGAGVRHVFIPCEPDVTKNVAAISEHLTKGPMNSLTFYLPAELEMARHEIRRFFEAVLFKLRKNAHRGKWEGYNLAKAFELLDGEIQELNQAAREGNSVEILLEGADVAAYALIIASIAVEKGA